MVLGLRLFTQRTGAGQPVLDAENGEELMQVQPSVSIALANRPPESPGTLYVSTKQVVWLSDTDLTRGYAVDFLSISLHAVSRDPEAYSSPCIYAQIETEDDESDDSDSEHNDNLDLSKIREMRLIPSDPNQLNTLFDIFCQCAELNPQPNSEGEEEEHNWIFSADQLADEGAEEEDFDIPFLPTNTIGYSNGIHDLADNVLELEINDQRFDDAEEMEHDNESGHQ